MPVEVAAEEAACESGEEAEFCAIFGTVVTTKPCREGTTLTKFTWKLGVR